MKRAEMSRGTGFARLEFGDQLPAKTCGYEPCGRLFTPARPMQDVCSQRCAMRKVNAHKAAQKAADKARRKALETLPELKKAAQHAFNSYIRERDRQADRKCISSDRPLDWSGNGVDAGHYRSVGSAPHLRFNEDNCHAQSKHDNQFRSGNAVDYRLGLIKRIGLEAVEALEADNTPRHYTHDDLRAIAALYRAKLKALKEKT